MKNPLELLKTRHKEILNEYARVYNVKSSRTVGGSDKGHSVFEYEKNLDLGEIKKVSDEYSDTISILEGLNAYEYLKDKK